MTWKQLREKYTVRTFKTLDGVEIKINSDKCYAINKEIKSLIEGRNGFFDNWHGIKPDLIAYFSDKTKAAVGKSASNRYRNSVEWQLRMKTMRDCRKKPTDKLEYTKKDGNRYVSRVRLGGKDVYSCGFKTQLDAFLHSYSQIAIYNNEFCEVRS
jgi:hypothetical protein